MSFARRSASPARKWLVPAAFAAALLGYAQVEGRAQMHPFVPYRLTHNDAGEFTYVTGGQVSDIGYVVRDRTGGATFANAFVFVDGQLTVRLSDNASPSVTPRYVGRFDGQFVVSEARAFGSPPYGINESVNLLLHDGQSAVPVTNNPRGFAAYPYLLNGELLFSNAEFTTTNSPPLRTDMFRYTAAAGSVNLTNNPPGHHSRPTYVNRPGGVFMFTTYPDGHQDVLLSRSDGSPTIRVTSNVAGPTIPSAGHYGPDNGFFITVHDTSVSPARRDVFHYDGNATRNVTNNPPGVISGVAAEAGNDVIIAGPGLSRYRNGVLTNFTVGIAGSISFTQALGSDVVFSSYIAGGSITTSQTNLYLNRGATNVPLTNNPPGIAARFLSDVQGQLLIETTDYRNGTAASVASSDLFLHDRGSGSVNLFNTPPGVNAHYLHPFGEGIAFSTTDYRGGTGQHQQARDLFVHVDGATRRLSANAPGRWSGFPTATPAGIVFYTSVYPGAATPLSVNDVLLYDGQTSRNLTNFAPGRFATFGGMIGADLLLSVRDTSAGSFGPQTTDLVRYPLTGSTIPITQNSPGDASSLLEVRGGRAVWVQVDGGTLTGLFSGDGLSPVTTVFEPPAGQVMTSVLGWAGLQFFQLEAGTGAGRFNNLLVYLDGNLRPLTDNGPGWLAKLYRPVYFPNEYPPDAVIENVAIIELTTVAGDRRDVIVVLLPEPGWAAAAALACSLLNLRRRRNRATW